MAPPQVKIGIKRQKFMRIRGSTTNLDCRFSKASVASRQIEVSAQRDAVPDSGGAEFLDGVPHVFNGAELPVRAFPGVHRDGDARSGGRPEL